eukprot:TRINITY_DN13028_c0_g1_i3.p1 TRINITY_DN13028_c0_g1~~TRINITY_DN13028_c0_g1_i3.p1  ORF type:complete len:209 (-),score=32.64 TRINITY_DN13028_c0_g1_i3:263-889(-)
MSLVSRAPCSDECRAALRDAVTGGRMGHGIGFSNPIFWRSFQYFDTDKSGGISLRKFATGMHRICYGTLKERASYVFYVSDTESSGFLTEDGVLAFFTNFMELFSDLSIAVLAVERPFLMSAGVTMPQIEAHVQAIRACLKNSEDLILTQFQQTFRLLETACKNGKPLPFESWFGHRKELPKMYNKALNMVRGVLNQHTSMFHNVLLG